MSESVPEELKYTVSHEWVRRDPDGSVRVGITDHAQRALGSIVYAESSVVGAALEAGAACMVVESVKAASDIYAPVAGTVLEANTALLEDAEAINRDPYGAGWLVRLKPLDAAAVDSLLDAAAYRALIDANARC